MCVPIVKLVSALQMLVNTLLSCSTTNRRNLNVLPLFRSLGLAFVISRCLAKCSIIIKASNKHK